MNLKKEIKYIRDLAKVLTALAGEVEERKKFDKEDLELLKKIGANLLYQGASIDFLN